MTGENISDRNLKVGSRKWPDKLFIYLAAAFFFLLPLQTRYFLREAPFYEYGTLSVFLVEALGWVVIGLGVMQLFRHSKARSAEEYRTNVRKSRIRERSLAPLGMTLVGLAFLSVLWAPDKAVALQGAVRLLEGVLLYLVISTEAKRSGEISTTAYARGRRFLASLGMTEWWVLAFLAGATLQSFLGIYQFLTQSSFASTLLGIAFHDPVAAGVAVVEFGDERWLRAYGGLPHPNVLGGYLVVALALAFHSMGKLGISISKGQRYWLLAISYLLVTGIFFSFSRAAWLATAAVLIGFIGFIRPIRLIGLIFAGWIAALSIIYWPLVSARLNLQSTERLEVKARVERVEGVREAWEIIKRHPVAGVGIGNYTQGVARDVRPGNPLYTYQPVHNVPLLVWAELGLVGLIMFAVIIWRIIARMRGRFLAEYTPTVAPGLGMTMGILLLLDHYLWSLSAGILLFWAVLGLFGHHPQETA